MWNIWLPPGKRRPKPPFAILHLIVDNAAIHSSRATAKTLEGLGDWVVLHFPPPYYPEANLIERIWLDVHVNVTRNHRCRSTVKIMERVHAYLTARNAEHHASPRLRRSDLGRAA